MDQPSDRLCTKNRLRFDRDLSTILQTTGEAMRQGATRRQFLRLAGAGGAATGFGGLSFLGKLPAVSAQQARLNPARVVLDGSIAPLVKLLEDTPREQVLERVAERI